ncbi:radical SAM protein [Oricola sp.]|uniref:radical SAM protein n=1 Tax=Oricola sp. TaxID=1979950 RepID=UPI003BAC3A94
MNYVSKPVSDRDDGAMEAQLRPPRIRLEASTHCQLKCPTCETATGELYKTVAKGYLKFDNFKDLVDSNPWVREIELSNFGEIFLNPHILRIMEYAHEKGVHLRVSNGANLNTVRPNVLEGIVKYGVRHIRCSIDGASQEVYSQYRVLGNFDTVIENIRAINEYKHQYGTKYPELTWQFVAFGHNEHEIGKAKQMAAELGMDFDIKLNWDEKYSPIRDREAVAREVKSGVTSRSEYRSTYGEDYMERVCHQLWDQPQVNFDGTVWGCCRNNWQAFEGNAFEDGLEAALNSEQMSYARAMITGNAEPREDVPCTRCRIYRNFRKEGRYLDRDPDLKK